MDETQTDAKFLGIRFRSPPVTCQLTCPATDYISKFSQSGEIFLPRLLQGFPEIKEAPISNNVLAAFIVAPLAIALRAQGVPIKAPVQWVLTPCSDSRKA